MNDYTNKCQRCGLFLQTHNGEYPCLCKICADYMTEQKKKRIEQWKEEQNEID